MVPAGGLLMLCLCGCCRSMTLVGRGLFCSGRAGGCSTGSAVIANVVSRSSVDYVSFVRVVNVGDVDVVDRGVVVEGSVIPISALIADTTIAEAIVDAAVETDCGTPVAVVPGKGIATPAPIPGSPQQANGGRLGPRARHPEIAFITVSPVAGCPQIAALRTHRLRVRHQFRRSDRDRHADLRERGGRHGQYQNS